MNTQAVQTMNTPARATLSPAADTVKEKRANYEGDNSVEQAASAEKNGIQPEELLNNIKALTDDGLYSVRFEMNKDTNELVINLIEAETGDVIRQIPPEEIVNLREYMQDLKGNILSIES